MFDLYTCLHTQTLRVLTLSERSQVKIIYEPLASVTDGDAHTDRQTVRPLPTNPDDMSVHHGLCHAACSSLSTLAKGLPLANRGRQGTSAAPTPLSSVVVPFPVREQQSDTAPPARQSGDT